jgi:hypothetical protein
MSRCASLAVAVLIAVPPVARAQRFVDVKIKANDYAYINPPTSLNAGLTAFSFENTGAVPHEMILIRPKPGISPDSAARARAAGAPPQETTEAPDGILIALPGTKGSGRLLVDLERGKTYILMCNFRDMPDKPRHTALGMYSSFQVK